MTENWFSRPIIANNAGQKYCRMLQEEHSATLEHSAILLIFINTPFVIKIFILSIFEGPFYTDFTVPLTFEMAYLPCSDLIL